MKNKLCIFASILVVLCMICSCSNGGGAEGDAQKTVALRLAVTTDDSTAKAITVTNPTLTGLTYQYMATPKFTSEFASDPQGKTAKWTDFPTNAATSSLGNFAQGWWEFEVRLIKKTNSYNVDDESTYTLAYQTSEAVGTYLNATTTANPIEITVVKKVDAEENKKGTLQVTSITAPTRSENDKLVITYGPVGGAKSSGNDEITIPVTSRSGANPYTTTFGGSISMNPGLYWVTFTYNDGSADVGASTKFVEIIKNTTTKVSGNLDADKWIASSVTVKGVKGISCTTSTTTAEVTQGQSLSISFKGHIYDVGSESTATSDKIKYYFCNGVTDPVPIEVSTGNYEFAGSTSENRTYSWNTTGVAKGYYYINIIATDAAGNLATGMTTPIKITVK